MTEEKLVNELSTIGNSLRNIGSIILEDAEKIDRGDTWKNSKEESESRLESLKEAQVLLNNFLKKYGF